MNRAIARLSECGMRGLSRRPSAAQRCTSLTWWWRPGRAALTCSVDPVVRISATGEECDGGAMTMVAFSHTMVDVREPSRVDPQVSTAVAPHSGANHRPDLMLASIDHAMWFHTNVHADEWLLFAQDTPVARNGHGLARGLFFNREGVLVASVVQESLMRTRRH